MDTQDIKNFIFQPVDWMRTKHGEAFCIFGLMAFAGILWGTMSLAFGFPMGFWILAIIGITGLVFFLTTLVIFIIEENEKERKITEDRNKSNAIKRT